MCATCMLNVCQMHAMHVCMPNECAYFSSISNVCQMHAKCVLSSFAVARSLDRKKRFIYRSMFATHCLQETCISQAWTDRPQRTRSSAPLPPRSQSGRRSCGGGLLERQRCTWWWRWCHHRVIIICWIRFEYQSRYFCQHIWAHRLFCLWQCLCKFFILPIKRLFSELQNWTPSECLCPRSILPHSFTRFVTRSGYCSSSIIVHVTTLAVLRSKHLVDPC